MGLPKPFLYPPQTLSLQTPGMCLSLNFSFCKVGPIGMLHLPKQL